MFCAIVLSITTKTAVSLTTHSRQPTQMGPLLHKYSPKHFVDIIIGNEVLFCKDLMEVALAAAHGAKSAALGDSFRELAGSLSTRMDWCYCTSKLSCLSAKDRRILQNWYAGAVVVVVFSYKPLVFRTASDAHNEVRP
jgi:hypothetical protein